MASINPYLNFNGTTEEAFNFYKSVFGTEIGFMQRYKDMPPGEPSPADKNEGDKIMHIALPISKETTLMGSDIPSKAPAAVMGTNFAISVDTDTEAEAKKIFNALAAGGKIELPLEKAFWGAYFGMLTDKFGIQWMVSYQEKK